MTRALILANEHVNERMAGPAIRSFEMSHALVAAGHEVTLGAPFPSDLPPQPFPIVTYSEDNVEQLARDHDAIVLQGWVLDRFPQLRDCGARIVVDLYDPFPLEVLILSERAPLEVTVAEQQNAVRAVSDQVRAADFFLCASEKQRDYWLGWMTAMNRVNPHVHDADPTLRSLIDVVPFGVPAEAPRRRDRAIRAAFPAIRRDAFVLLWGGGVYNWFDPMTLIRGVGLAAQSFPNVRLVFMSTGHPNPAIQEMWTLTESRRLAAELGLAGTHVLFNESWVEYSRRADWLLDADVGVSTHFDHVETRFSFRTRILDYLWAGLPVLTTRGDSLGDVVEREGLGITVPPEAPAAVAEAILALAGDAPARAEMSARARARGAAMTWERATQPLVRYLGSARRAPDLVASAPRRRVPVLLTELPELREEDPVATGSSPSGEDRQERRLERTLRLAGRALPGRVRGSAAARRTAAMILGAAEGWRRSG